MYFLSQFYETWSIRPTHEQAILNKFYKDGAKIIQWLAERLDFFDVYDMKWGDFEWELRTLK